MPPDSTSDPRISKAITYLRRIQTYYESPHVLIYDTWTDFSVRNRTEIEVTTKNINVCRAVRHAVKVLGGKVSFPRVHNRVFIKDNRVERHRVLVFRFVI